MNPQSIFVQIPKVMADVGPIGKDGYNAHDKYKFRSIDDVYNKLQPALAKHSVFFVPNVLESKEEKVTSAKGNEMLRTKIKVRYDVYSADGSKIETTVEGEAIDRGDKATNKALTAAFKYMLIQVFCIAVEGQEDADSESPEIGKDQSDSDLGSYVPSVGKFSGQRLIDVDVFELDNYVKWLREGEIKDRKDKTGKIWKAKKLENGMLEFVEAAEAFLKSREFEIRLK